MLDKIIAWIKRLFLKNKETDRVYSLEEYLDLVSKYTDSVILREKANKNYFTGGECKTNVLDDKHVKFSIQMYFINDQNERTLRTSERVLLISNFDDKSQKFMGEGEKVFEILVPKGDK